MAFIIFGAMLFDGYDLVIYGVALPRLLADPSQIGPLDPAVAGLVGSYALIGVLVGSLFCGSIGDFFGRRKLMIGGIAWFSIGMIITAHMESVFAFGLMRFITGVGLGIAIATAGATMAEFAPAGDSSTTASFTVESPQAVYWPHLQEFCCWTRSDGVACF